MSDEAVMIESKNDYMERVRQKRARNQAELHRLGLLNAKDRLREASMPSPPAKKSKAQPRSKPPSQVSPDIGRRSRRIAKRSSSSASQDNDEEEDSLVMLSYLNDDDASAIRQDDARRSDTTSNIDDKTTTERRARSRVRVHHAVQVPEPTPEQKIQLQRTTMGDNQDFLPSFHKYLVSEDKISEQNMRSVMRQIGKLARGEGIHYESPKYGWPEGCFFQRGNCITPMHDITKLMEEAEECENEWGRDHGNGWLLSHPLKKLLNFQQFALAHPESDVFSNHSTESGSET